MRKRCILLLVFVLLLLPTIFADTSLDAEIKKATHYAEEYEIGNINYVQLLVHISAVRENLNELLGAISKHHGGLIEEENLRAVLGEPADETKWVWSEKKHNEKKLDKAVPRWEKIVFDGKKIQMRMDAHPTLFQKGYWDDEQGEWVGEGEEFLVYRLHLGIEFKKDVEAIDFEAKFKEIENLAMTFNDNPSDENADNLARESVNAERAFENYFRQGGGDCVETMNDLLGEENNRGEQNLLVQEIILYEGDNFEAKTNLEMCDDCEWNWIGLNTHLEGRGPGFKPQEFNEKDRGRMRSEYESREMTAGEFKSETMSLVGETIGYLESGDFKQAMLYSQRLSTLTDVWNQAANDIWKEIEQVFEQRRQTMSEEEERQFHENYGWIKEDQERRKTEKEKRLENYRDRKTFYISLFEPYDKKEFFFNQIEYEKRLIQEFKEKGEEICDNNMDDNENEQIDCQEDQCGGQICGKQVMLIDSGNGTVQETVNLYCIAGTCQVKEEQITPLAVCGNNICEAGELDSCATDCSVCPIHEPIECAGKVVFSGEDENGCSLQPVCIEEKEFCQVNEDCSQPLCGVSECIRFEPEDDTGICRISELKGCEEASCIDGEEKVLNCPTGEKIVKGICDAGVWIELEDAACPEGANVTEEIEEEETVGEECVVKLDCGGENDVCSNGKCVTIPEIIIIESEEPETIPEEEEEVSEEPEQTPEPAAFILSLFDNANFRTIGFVTAEEGDGSDGDGDGSDGDDGDEGANQDDPPEEGPPVCEGGCDDGDECTDDWCDEGNCQSAFSGDRCPDDSRADFHEDGDGSEGDYDDPQCWEECWEEEYCEDFCNVGEDGVEVCEPECHTNEKCEDVCEGEARHDDNKDWEDNERHDDQKGEERGWGENCDEMCKRECFDAKVRPCTEKCIRDVCGEDLECDIDKERKNCEDSCSEEKDLDGCVVDCEDKCEEGEWEGLEGEWEEKEWQEEKGVFAVGGSCRTVQGKKEGFIWFNGWGEPFEEIQELKHEYYQGGQADWCKWDLENLEKQRLEFEQSFNQEFVEWFFEDYMANTAENWEQHMSGIHELYWNNVRTLEETVYRGGCLDRKGLPDSYTPIELISYETDYGKLEYWEEVKTARLPGPDGTITVEMITPYMKIWVFPPKEFIIHELQKSMINGEFPGSPEEKMERDNEGGLSEEEKMSLKEDEDFMDTIRDVTDKYDGDVDVVIRFVDYEKDDLVFNLYVKISEENIMEMKPMLPADVPEEDVRIEMDFTSLYDLIYTSEKEMGGDRIEIPHWDKQTRPTKFVKEVTNGIKMFFKVRSMVNSAEVTPPDAKSDVNKLFRAFVFRMMREGGEDKEGEDPERTEELEEDLFGSKEALTGEVILK